MDMFLIEGGHRLRGEVRIEGSKNAALPILATTLMIDGEVILERVPALQDVATMNQLLLSMGVHVRRTSPALSSGELQLLLDARPATIPVASYDLVSQMRASICVLGPLIARFGRARVSLPGGCDIGHRPIDLHLKGLASLGADLRLENGYVIAEASRLKGAEIFLSGPHGSTVTGTCNIMTAAATAAGQTIIRSAACEPEVAELGRFLNGAGAQIQGLGTSTIEIQGVERLHGLRHTIPGDRIEAATLMIAAAVTDGDVILRNVPLDAMENVLVVLKDIGLSIEPCELADSASETLRVRRARPLSSRDIVADPYPGWPTDAQAQMMALLSLVPGTSLVTDRVFPDRFRHASELIRMGADIRVSAGSSIIRGVPHLAAATVMASDLRASAALVLAGLAAEGTTCIRRVHHLDRGYAAFEQKLNSLGARVERISEESTDQRHTLHSLEL